MPGCKCSCRGQHTGTYTHTHKTKALHHRLKPANYKRNALAPRSETKAGANSKLIQTEGKELERQLNPDGNTLKPSLSRIKLCSFSLMRQSPYPKRLFHAQTALEVTSHWSEGKNIQIPERKLPKLLTMPPSHYLVLSPNWVSLHSCHIVLPCS